MEPSSTLRTEVANLLRKQILDGDIPCGERLIETEIASQLGVSRMPVREALRMLESEGLINQVPRKGLIVAEYTENDIREYYTIREALEVCAMPRLKEQIKTTQKYLRTFRFTSFKEATRTEQALKEHAEIIRLVEKKDYEGAALATSVHLRDAMQAYIRLWRQRKGKM